jgi:hypothetical protein
MNDEELKTVRRLVVALTYVRCVCEHTQGLTEKDDTRLSSGLCVAADACYAVRNLVPDYQKDSFWKDVRALEPQ